MKLSWKILYTMLQFDHTILIQAHLQSPKFWHSSQLLVRVDWTDKCSYGNRTVEKFESRDA